MQKQITKIKGQCKKEIDKVTADKQIEIQQLTSMLSKKTEEKLEDEEIARNFGYRGNDPKWQRLLFCTYDLFNRDFVGRIKFMNMIQNWVHQGGNNFGKQYP